MIPILFEGTATSFLTNGIGRLTDTISCEVVEERNGVFELTLVYPTTGVHYSEIKTSRLIVVKPNKNQERQAFEIYEIQKPIDQKVTIRAQHVSYRQSYVPVQPFIAHGINNTLNGLIDNSMESNSFTFTTDIDNTDSTFDLIVPTSMRKCLGGMEGSVLDVFSGSSGVEYLWDNFNTFVTLHRGIDNGVHLRYRKNITDIKQTENIDNVITGVLPMWSNSDNTVTFFGDIQYSPLKDNYPVHRTLVLDLSSEFENAPAVSQLNAAGQQYVNTQGLPSTNIKVSFLDLSSFKMFEDVTVLEEVNLCDIVHVFYAPLEIEFTAKVIKTTWDVLKDRYISIEIGSSKSSISKTISDVLGDVSSVVTVGKKLVSVTQKIDREVGEISSTVASVQETTSTITNMLYDTNAPSLAKVYGPNDRYFSSVNNADYIECTYISLTDAPRPTINYGVNINVIQTIPSGRVRAIAWPNLTLTAGTTYTVSCYARVSTASSGGNIGVYFCYGANPYADAGYSETYYATSTDWTRFSWTFTADSTYFNASGKTLIYVGMFALSGTTAGGIDICNYFLQTGEPSGIDTKGSAIYQLPSDLAVLNGNVDANTEQIQNVESHVNTVQQTAEGNTRTITSVQENIGQNYYTKTETTAKITESANGITEQYTTAIQNGINAEEQRVTTMIRRSGQGIAIGLEGNQIEGRFDNDSLDFVDTQNNDNRLAWVDANEGLGGSALAVGDPSNIGNRWRIFTRQSGTHLTFTRHS